MGPINTLQSQSVWLRVDTVPGGGGGGWRGCRSSRTSHGQPSGPRPRSSGLEAERRGNATALSLSHRPSPEEDSPPGILRLPKSHQGSLQTKLYPEYRSRWRGSPRSAWAAGRRGAPARGGDDTPGPEVRKLLETRDTPLSGGRGLVDLLHSLAETLKFLPNAHIQAPPRPGWGGGPRVPPVPAARAQAGGAGGTRLSFQHSRVRGPHGGE